MEQNIIKLFIEKGFLLDKEMYNFLNELKDEDFANEIINKIAIISKQKLITKNLVNKNLEKIKPMLTELEDDKKRLVENFFVNVSISFEVKKETILIPEENKKQNDHVMIDNRKIDRKVKIISSPMINSQKIEVKDFVRSYRQRYNSLKNIIQQNPQLENLTSIDKIGANNRVFSIIAAVNEKFITKNKNVILDVEDLTGKTKLLINQNKEEIYEKSKEILQDDIIGFKCSGSKDFLYVNDLYYPDSFLSEKHRTKEEVYALFISDIHIGSKNFLEKNFRRFIDWMNCIDCDEKQKQTIKNIKYMFVVGDSIDGVGVYPGQEKDLCIKDIKEQYRRLAEFYKDIPKHISIIQCPGQHDAVRVAEPQPPIGKDFGEDLFNLENIFLVSNPSMVEIAYSGDRPGIKVLMYHGASMHPIINEIETLRVSNSYKTPAKVVKHMLLRRHLAPTHGNIIYIPDSKEDHLVIKEVPDIVTTGDLHRPDVDKYNGTLLISCSCWQSITAFEEKVGNVPDPCKVPMLNLKTGEIKILDFSDAIDDTKQ